MKTPSAIDILEDLKNNHGEIKDFDTALEKYSVWHRHLLIGDIDPDVGEAVEMMIRFWNRVDDEEGIPVDKREPIIIYIDSNGGDLDATFTMIDAIRISKTPVWTVNMGCAFSGGFFTYIVGHKRIAYPHSTFLYHEGATGQIADAGKFQNFAAFYKVRLGMLKNIVLEHTDISPELYEEKRRDDWWFTAQEGLDFGVVDEITDKFV